MATGKCLLKLAQIARAHNAQLLKLDKAIPPMIQQAIKIAMNQVVDKLGSLCAQYEVAFIRKEIYRRKDMIPPMDINLNIPIREPDTTVAERSLLDDWCTGYNPSKGTTVGLVQEGKPPHEKVPPTMEVSPHSDPSRVAPIYSYHEARTLLNRLVATSPSDPLVLPPDPLMPSVVGIAKKYFS
ncbi:hypothetical protein HAX54_048751 [Datura stramonium]|uniref:Uncharacterized protein n=1 Tax=Datura stramonium TaxID=4076 RepID=A0ABS8SVS6_DATST|nr:hypothetical protein [Datura stramonium]